jgi:hypothetical protein
MDKLFFKDSDIAEMLSMSGSWVRHQRYLRRHAKPHVLNIDPIMVGSKPRYRTEDVHQMVGSLNSQHEGGLV